MSDVPTLKTFFDTAIKLGIRKDPRGEAAVRREMEYRKKDYDGITDPASKEAFDTESLENPYHDSRLLHGDPDTPLGRIMAGIDIGTAEVLLADRLGERGRKIDLIVSHHPAGKAHAQFQEVMRMQAEMLSRLGVPINQAEGALGERIEDIRRKVAPGNHNRMVDAARILDIPVCCIHTPADNHVHAFLNALMKEKDPYRLSDIMEILHDLPVYRRARALNNGPRIFLGKEKNRCGRIAFEMTGGTSGSPEAIRQMAEAGIGTLVVMHIPEDHRKNCKDYHINIISAGHIASDSLGINEMLKGISESTGQAPEMVPVSGYLYEE